MGQVKAMWMEQNEEHTPVVTHVPGKANHFKLETVMVERTPIVEAWAFKGQVYAKAFIDAVPGGTIRKLVMYRLPTPTIVTDENAEKMVARVLEAGDIDLFLWEEVKTMWEGEGGERKPTREELIEEGKRTGVCQVCHRKLTNPVSVAAGIGPICSGRI